MPDTGQRGGQFARKGVLFVAQGFGTGRAPYGPGTVGSLVGLVWFWALLWSESFVVYVGLSLFAILGSVWLAEEAERILGQHDPGSVVIDEIIAVPICFFVWMGASTLRYGTPMAPSDLLTGNNGLWVVVGFLLFRVFDIWKPWPCSASQKWPGGYGVTMDDAFAAIYVNICFLLFLKLGWV